MKNKFKGLSESRKLEMLQMSIEEIYNFGHACGSKEKEITNHVQRKVKQIAKTPNQKRAEIIQRAKEFVVLPEDRGLFTERKGFRLKGMICDAEFVVNAEKNTVVCILRRQQPIQLVSKGIAKCDPSDVYNVHIGKAIALGRALGLDVSEFEQAVQPTKPVVGHIVIRRGGEKNLGQIRKLIEDNEDGSFKTKESTLRTDVEYIKAIIDDTNANYGEIQ